MKIAAIIPAAGRGKRLKTKKLKPFISVAGKPLLIHTLLNLKKSCRLEQIILAVPADQEKNFKELLKRYRLNNVLIVIGGRSRAESVRNGLEEVSDSCDWVLVHDAARPLVSKVVVKRLVQCAKKTGGAIAALPVTSTVKRVYPPTAEIARTEDRGTLYLAQTPQLFKKKLLMDRYRVLGKKALAATDEAALFDGSGVKVGIALGEARNIKITTPEDIELFKFYLKKK